MTTKQGNVKVSRKELINFLKNICISGRFQQRKSYALFIVFCTVNGYMFSNSLFLLFQYFISGYTSTTGELIRASIGFISSLFIFAYLRLTVPRTLMRFNIENNTIKMSITQHVISTVLVLIPASLFIGAFFLLNGI